MSESLSCIAELIPRIEKIAASMGVKVSYNANHVSFEFNNELALIETIRILGLHKTKEFSFIDWLVNDACEKVTGKKVTSKDAAEHYNFVYQGILLDPYRILDVYGIKHPAQQHAIKKLLRAGNSSKDLNQDIQEAILTLKRWLEMIEGEK